MRKTTHFFINPYHQLLLFLILLLAALFLKRYRLSKNVAILLTLWWLSILFPIYEQLIFDKEGQWVPLQFREKVKSTDHIVVLGGGKVSDPRLPVTTQLNSPQLARLIEGVRIYNHTTPQCFITSATGHESMSSIAKTVAEAAVLLGVNSADTIMIESPTTTQQEAAFVRKRFPDLDTITLVTSAMHMRRAKVWFEHHGFYVVPAPTDYLVKIDPNVTQSWLINIKGRMEFAHAFWYEWAGRMHGRWLGLSFAE